MKKLILGICLTLSVTFMTFNAHAMVTGFSLACGPLHYSGENVAAANAPSFALSCSMTTSFGPTSVSCAAREMAYFPHVSQVEIALREVSTSENEIEFRGEDGVEVLLSLQGVKSSAEITYGPYVATCSEGAN